VKRIVYRNKSVDSVGIAHISSALALNAVLYSAYVVMVG